MHESAKRYLHYVRASLADATRLMPDVSAKKSQGSYNTRSAQAVAISVDEIEQGKFSQHATRQICAIASETNDHWPPDTESLWPIRLIICPRVYAQRPEHGKLNEQLPEKVVPVFVCACLHEDGSVSIDEGNRTPIIPREYLEPTHGEIAIGTVDEADAAYATLVKDCDTWTALLRAAFDLVQKVTDSPLDELRIEPYERLSVGLAVLQRRDVMTFHIQRLVDLILTDDMRAHPLYEAFIAPAPHREIKTGTELLDTSTLHLGQMESQYGLSLSQREALLHFLSEEQGTASILAVDGPPGTGKTTLLLSAIATLWVQHALEGLEAPLIVASSTNNQAILNILEAFTKVHEKPDCLAGRWLADIKSYGLYLPAKSQEDRKVAFPVHKMQGQGREATYDAQKFETPDGLTAAREEFLCHFEAAFGPQPANNLCQAAQYLRGRLKSATDSVATAVRNLRTLTQFVPLEKITSAAIASAHQELAEKMQSARTQFDAASAQYRGAQELRLGWKKHVSSEPWWIGLLAHAGLRTPRVNRDSTFCAEAEMMYTALLHDTLRKAIARTEISATIDALVDKGQAKKQAAEESYHTAERDVQEITEATEALRQLDLGRDGLTADAVQSALDVGPRCEAFKLATHYWEARYLAEVEERLRPTAKLEDSKSPRGLEQQYRRLAKLFPCFISTLFTLPDRFIGWRGKDLPLFGAVDLLIVDEAGQVSPEVGVASCTLAKCALVVGDVDQIPPVWNIPHTIDAANARRYLVIEGDSQVVEFVESGMSASGGSLMRMAQRATPYAKHPSRGRGMFLHEHRRCWPEIIHICNTLVYRGLLKPCREEQPRKLVPTVGYVHIPGRDERVGKSRKNLVEATAIAKWLVQREDEIKDAFSVDCKPFNELVAVITPFTAQTRAVRAALAGEFGSTHGITVGTIHALQGAERRVVIFSPTYGPGTEPGNTFFDHDRSMLNVAISRAQDAFLLFGNMHLFQPNGSHPSAVVGSFLFQGGDNEIKDVPTQLLVPGYDMAPGQLIRDLAGHRAALDEAFKTAKSRLVIVSPFLTRAAIKQDQVLNKIHSARARGVQVRIVTDRTLNKKDLRQFDECVHDLKKAGAGMELRQNSGVHSKMVLVDTSWLVVGSFNWLSAARDPTNPYARYEASIRYDGNESFQMISKALRDLFPA